MAVFSRAEVDRCKKFRDVTSNGVPFYWELVSSAGGYFFLIRDVGVTDADLEEAKKELRRSRDVVGLEVASVEGLNCACA